jgi:hypothetical protein
MLFLTHPQIYIEFPRASNFRTISGERKTRESSVETGGCWTFQMHTDY